MAGEPLVTIVGNVVADPEARISQGGKPWVTFRIASTPRQQNQQTKEWEDGEPLWMGCRAYGEHANNIAASLRKGMRVVVLGRMTQRNYTDKQNMQRTSLELEVEEVGPSLRFATASTQRGGAGAGGGGGAAASHYGQPQPAASAYGQPQPAAQQQAQPQGQPAWGQPAAPQQQGGWPAQPQQPQVSQDNPWNNAGQQAQAAQQPQPQQAAGFGGGFDDEQPF